MKKRNVLTKLVMSGVALAATAATLSATTYAWYTTNTSVEANQISGATADSGAASVFISKNGSTGWAQKLSGSSEITFTTTKLTPVALKSTGTDTKVTKWYDQKGEEVVSPSYVEFTLYFKTAKTASDVNLGITSITVANTTTSVKAVDNLLTGSQYSVDVLNSLAIQIDSPTKTTLKEHGYSLTPGQGCVSLASDASAYSASPITDTATKSAHAYANAVVAGSVTEDTTQTAALPANTVVAVLPSAGTATSVTFRIFLDGADTECFDACKDQTFKVNMTFGVVTA